MLDGSSGPSQGHKRNCILITCYLGLSQHAIESIPFGSSSSAKSRPCHTCGRRITLGNFAKHLTTHDPNKKYKCERCGHGDNRSDDFAKHEKSCQKRRTTHDLDDGLNNATRPPRLAEETQPQANNAFLDTLQHSHLNNMSLGNEQLIPLHQSPCILELMNASINAWSPYMDTRIPPTSAAHIPETPHIDSLPWKNNWAVNWFNQTSISAQAHCASPEAGYSLPLDQPIIPQLPFRDDFNKLLTTTEALSSTTRIERQLFQRLCLGLIMQPSPLQLLKQRPTPRCTMQVSTCNCLLALINSSTLFSNCRTLGWVSVARWQIPSSMGTLII
jgi:hypothetical protein